VCENTDAPLLGCAILASVGVGIQPSVEAAVRAMVRTAQRIEPQVERVKTYRQLYENVYSKIAAATRPVAHAIHDELIALRIAAAATQSRANAVAELKGGSQMATSSDEEEQDQDEELSSMERQTVTVSPSLLSCDWAHMHDEVHRCLHAGARILHLDIFDGVFLNSPEAFTFGPRMVAAIRNSCNSYVGDGKSTADDKDAVVVLDLHMCVERPLRFVTPMAQAGASRFIFQWEAVVQPNDTTTTQAAATTLVEEIAAAGMECGISLNPRTEISEELLHVLQSGKVQVVDILAVEPGFGGQAFQEAVLQKMSTLRQFREEYGLTFQIMVDGGVNDRTAKRIVQAGADILVSGSFLFENPAGMEAGIQALTNK